MAYSLKDDIEAEFFGHLSQKAQMKRKLNMYFDLYGEDRMTMENRMSKEEFYDFLLASSYVDEVLKERHTAANEDDIKPLEKDNKADEKTQQEEAKESSLLRKDHKAENKMREDMARRKDEKTDKALSKASHDVRLKERDEVRKKNSLINEFIKEKEDYKPRTGDKADMVAQLSSLMDKYGDDLDISVMTKRDANTYLKLEPLVKDVLKERDAKYDSSSLKKRHLEYTFLDNFTPLKKTLKDDKEFREFIESSEDIVSYPYLDTNGYKTAGKGYLSENLEKFLSYPWNYLKEDGSEVPATRAQKLEAYEQLEDEREKLLKEYEQEQKKNSNKKGKGPFNYLSRYYENVTRLRLPKAFIEDEYKRQVDEALKRVKTSFDNYNEHHPDQKIYYKKLPQDVLKALAELAYNVGHLDTEYPIMMDALARGDYETAAQQSHRANENNSPITEKRNQYVYNTLIKYAKK